MDDNFRDPTTESATTTLTQLVAEAVAHLNLDVSTWEQAVVLAKEDLLALTQRAVRTIGEGGLHTVGFQSRAQELAIRIDIFETLLSQIENVSLTGE